MCKMIPPIAPIAATEFRRVTDGPRVTPEMLEPFLFQDRFTLQAVIVNGKLVSGLSSLSNLPEGVTISGMAEAMTTQPPLEGPGLKSDHPFVLVTMVPE